MPQYTTTHHPDDLTLTDEVLGRLQTEPMFVERTAPGMCDVTRWADSPDEGAKTCTVDLFSGMGTCPSAEYHGPWCKHALFAMFEQGMDGVVLGTPLTVDGDTIPDSKPETATDGGVPRDRTTMADRLS